MLFHGFETQATRVGDLLIAAPIAHQTHQMLFSLREPRQMRQRSRGRARTVWAPAQAFEFNEKMRPRYCGRTDLFQTDSGAKISPRWMPNCLVAELAGASPRGLSCLNRFLRARHPSRISRGSGAFNLMKRAPENPFCQAAQNSAAA